MIIKSNSPYIQYSGTVIAQTDHILFIISGEDRNEAQVGEEVEIEAVEGQDEEDRDEYRGS